MEWIYNDGGRSNYFKSSNVKDCVYRAIAIATKMDYMDVYNLIESYAKKERAGKHPKSSTRSGVRKDTTRKILEDLGWKWVATMNIGSGCKVHLTPRELPKGTIIVSVSKHVVTVIDGVIYDTFDPSRDEGRCVYGYFYKPDTLTEDELNYIKNDIEVTKKARRVLL